jgi:GntR family transcriptional regulator, arabinose operon transcriptional repressor
MQMADHLRKQIESRALLPGERLAAEPELAEQFGLSRGTVRQALTLLVEEGLLKRVQGKGTFILGKAVTGAKALVGVIVPYLRDSLTVGILRGVERTMRASGYSLIYGSSDGLFSEECEQIRRLQDNQISGLIQMPISCSNEAAVLSQILSPHLPLVVIDRRIPGYDASSVMVDNFGGGVMAVEHLLERGHRRIACIMHQGYVSSIEERVRGYEHAMRMAGLTPLAAVPLVWHGPTHEGLPPSFTDDEMLPVAQLLQSADRPTALFCVNDFIAHGVIQFVHKSGWKVPEDLALVGFDDIPLASFMPAPLTTIAQPTQEIGCRAAQLLLNQIKGQSVGLEHVVLPVSIVIRDSTRLTIKP